MIVARVHQHVGPRRYVAVGAADRRIDALVKLMGRDRIFVRRVALQANAVARELQLRTVRVVAVAAGDAPGEHLALLERAVVVDLVLHLPVGEIEAAAQRGYDMRVGQPSARNPVL
jgi:threonine dehydrogenase-like Zn-dependent dehydrogenase